jgi:uroporphyrin-3 C-methyltransferase
MPPLIAPEEEFYLAQNLALKIEVARVAALRGDGAIFQDSLNMALEWIDSYFETDDERVANVIDELRDLQKVELHPYVPDVSRVSQAFKEVMDTRQPLKTMPDPVPEQDTGEDADKGGTA